MRGIVETGRYWDVETDEQIVQLRATVSAEWRGQGASRYPEGRDGDWQVGDCKVLLLYGLTLTSKGKAARDKRYYSYHLVRRPPRER